MTPSIPDFNDIRAALEQRETLWLGPHAAKSNQSKGREKLNLPTRFAPSGSATATASSTAKRFVD
jgi:hypothetical protein